MSRAFRSKFTYANVMATLAVFIALGGSSYAVISLSRNSVKSKHIAKGAVKRSDIGKNAVNSLKVADASLLATDFAPGQLPSGEKGDPGPRGDQGERGLVGPTFGVGFTPQAGVISPAEDDITTRMVTTPSAGDLLVIAQNDGVNMDCTPDAGADIALYLDGQPLQFSLHRFPDTQDPVEYDKFGIVQNVAAGTHALTVGLACVGPSNLVGFSSAGTTLAAVLLGGS